MPTNQRTTKKAAKRPAKKRPAKKAAPVVDAELVDVVEDLAEDVADGPSHRELGNARTPLLDTGREEVN